MGNSFSDILQVFRIILLAMIAIGTALAGSYLFALVQLTTPRQMAIIGIGAMAAGVCFIGGKPIPRNIMLAVGGLTVIGASLRALYNSS
jgi:hypothetical protein